MSGSGAGLAFLAACSFAIGTVLQQRGTLDTTSSGDAHWLLEILHKPVWLSGMVLQGAGWVLQAMALDRGPLMMVQAIATLSIVIALPFGAWLTDQHIDRTVVLGALCIVAGIIVFLSVGSPQGGDTNASATTWWLTIIATVGLVAVLATLGWRRHGAARALLFGSAAGVGFALQTAVTKDFVTEIGGGVLSLLANWSIYVLIASAISGFVLQQSALKTGFLAPAMASSNAVCLFGGVVLGRVVYDETLSQGGARLGPAILGLALSIVGITVLARAAGPPGTSAPAGESVPSPAARP